VESVNGEESGWKKWILKPNKNPVSLSTGSLEEENAKGEEEHVEEEVVLDLNVNEEEKSLAELNLSTNPRKLPTVSL